MDEFPDNIKIAKLIPIYKTDDTSNCPNYRPISILPCFSKHLEKFSEHLPSLLNLIFSMITNMDSGKRTARASYRSWESDWHFYSPNLKLKSGSKENNPILYDKLQARRPVMGMIKHRRTSSSWSIAHYRSTFQKFDHEGVCCDSTHGTNAYEFKLMTVLVIDQFGQSFPVGWCLSNHKDFTSMCTFFKEVTKNCGSVQSQSLAGGVKKESWWSSSGGWGLQNATNSTGTNQWKLVSGLFKCPAGEFGSWFQEGLGPQKGTVGILLQSGLWVQYKHVCGGIPQRIQETWQKGEQACRWLSGESDEVYAWQVFWMCHQVHEGKSHLQIQEHCGPPSMKPQPACEVCGTNGRGETECLVWWWLDEEKCTI